MARTADEIEFEFTGFEDVEDVAFALGFCNVEGVRILTLDSDLEGGRWTIHHGQKRLARFRLPKLFLESDHYLLDVGCRSGDQAALEYLPQCAQVLVVPSESTPALIATRDSLHGGYRLPGQWDLEARENRNSRQLNVESLR